MGNDTIMNAGIEELRIMKEKVSGAIQSRNKREELSSEAARLKKAIASKEKAINDEIAATTKKRRQGVEGSFNKEEERLRAKKKKTEAVKGKDKDKQVSERIAEETAEYQETIRKLKKEAKELLKQNKIPFFYSTKLFFALYYPKRIRDYVLLAILVCIAFCGVPSLVWYLVPYDAKWFYPVVSLASTLIFVLLYVVFGRNARKLHNDTFVTVSKLKQRVVDNEKLIKKIKKNIVSDEDESRYGLEKYDQDIQEVEEALQKTLEEKKTALEQFDNVTRGMINDDIRERNREELEQLQKSLEETEAEHKKAEEINRKLTIEVSAKYEVFLGREVLTEDYIDKMIAAMESGQASTIGEAIEAVRKE